MNQSESYIGVNSTGEVTSFVGEDATNLFRAITVTHALRMYARTGMLMTRGATPTKLLTIAKEYTGKNYTGGDKYVRAADDVQVWVNTMRAALPVVWHVERPVCD